MTAYEDLKELKNSFKKTQRELSALIKKYKEEGLPDSPKPFEEVIGKIQHLIKITNAMRNTMRMVMKKP